MTSLTPSVRKMTGCRLLGVVLISLCYFTAFLVLLALSDPYPSKNFFPELIPTGNPRC